MTKRQLQKRAKAANLKYQAARAHADYACWKEDRFESELASLILRIGRYDKPLKFKVTADEVIAVICRLTGYKATQEEAIDFMHRRMQGR